MGKGGRLECFARWGKRLAVTAAASGGIIYAGWRIYSWQLADERDDGDENIRQREHYARIQHTCLKTVMNLLTPLQESVSQLLNSEAITLQLQTNPPNKLTMWENLKLISFSRAIVSCCVAGMLVVLVRLELSVLAAFIYLTHKGKSSNPVTVELQKKYLSVMQQRFQRGLSLLAQTVSAAAEQVLLSYSLKHRISLEQTQQLLADVLEQASATQRRDQCSWLLQFLFPQGSPTVLEEENGMRMLLIATEDALEIGDVQELLDVLVEQALLRLTTSLADSFQSAAQSSPVLALAQVIPIISDHSMLLLDPQHHSRLIQELANNENMIMISRNVYEGFRSE